MFSMREFRDLDLMMKLNHEGPLLARELAKDLGADEYGRHLGTRLAWMRRYGILDKTDKGVWSLTDAGNRVVHAKQRARLLDELGKLPVEELIEVMAAVIARSQKGDPMVGTMLRREFIFGTSRTL